MATPPSTPPFTRAAVKHQGGVEHLICHGGAADHHRPVVLRVSYTTTPFDPDAPDHWLRQLWRLGYDTSQVIWLDAADIGPLITPSAVRDVTLP